MNKTLKRLLGAVIVLAVLFGLAWPKLDAADDASAGGPPDGGGPLQVEGAVASHLPLTERVLTTGTLRANEQVDLASETSGKVTEVLFSEGRRVEKGQLLVKINDAELRAQRERILYRLRLAEQRVERQKALLEKGGVSQEEFDQTQSELDVLKAELLLNEAQLAKTEVRAPFDGVLGLRHVSEGSYINPQNRIATLQDVSPIKIDFSVPEKYAGLVRPGRPIRFQVEGSPQVRSGSVFAVEPRIDENTRTLQVRAESPNRNESLLPGAFADVEVVVGEHTDALVVPTIAVIPELGGKMVFAVEQGRVQPRTVQTGIRTDSVVQVTSGLSPGDTVLTTGLQLARPGMPVEISVR